MHFGFQQEKNLQTQIRRSFSVPGNAKNRSLQRTDSTGFVRVIVATPRPVVVNNTFESDAIETVNGTVFKFLFYKMSCLLKFMLKNFFWSSVFVFCTIFKKNPIWI